jgi:PHS family inorganic phosphate transporter-like MFS transporter
MGRRRLQILGFGVMGVCYFLIALVPDLREILPLFVLIFGVSFFFVNFGPNATTFLIPSEI